MPFSVKLMVVAIICTFYLFNAVASPDHLCSSDETERMGVCGTHLADDLSLVCRAVYNKRGTSEVRDVTWSQYPKIVMKRDTNIPTVDWAKTANMLDKVKRKNMEKLGKVALEKRNAFAYISTIRQGGLVCECCVHNCGLDEMKMYCGNVEDDQ
ncbi:con-Ins Tx1-like [Ylistrum balloti]|uniref:con-Ins Tx1-like n=1 Tax=Ylistrum balloti TaxID=509963 RepID=UPI002905F36D|nr:con-Ins Tx1-like [Ylistrum balloti]